MKKVIDGALYNTQTAKKICERLSEGPDHLKGAQVKKIKQLYKTRSGNYFFYIKLEFNIEVAVNKDDLNPIHEAHDVIDEKIIPVTYELAFQFASEVNSDPNPDSNIAKYFPELVKEDINKNSKTQKKIYLSEKADWYLRMMIQESDDTNSSFIEKLIIEKYQALYSKGVMNRDPFFEMED